MINAIDICGTGGNPHHTLSISTAAAFVVAACGVPVAKHAGRARTSLAGSIDVLEAFGCNVDLSIKQCKEALERTDICFVNADFVGSRRDTPIDTVLNNPLNPSHRMIGVCTNDARREIEDRLPKYRGTKGYVYNSAFGFDEFCPACSCPHIGYSAPKKAKHLDCDALKGGTAEYNAIAIKNLFWMRKHNRPYYDAVVLNAGVAIHLFTGCSVRDGRFKASMAIDTGEALSKLLQYAQVIKDLRRKS
jgi:anthranilate phosphoribosyltransferase